MIRFNESIFPEKAIEYFKDVFLSKHTSGDGEYTKRCHSFLNKKLSCMQSLLVHSGTAALEIAAICANLKNGDEVIMPSYTFSSTANAFVLQGAIPVFIDIRTDTLDINENLLEQAITNKTKVIVPVHYAGVACAMDDIMRIAEKYKLLVIEDAAQSYCSFYKGVPLGTIGDMGCLSFHQTKNIMSGEGGAFVTNNPQFAEKAEVVREKGTNRSKFFRGQVDMYTWIDKGSSYLPSDLIAAYLLSTLESADKIQIKRKKIWDNYYSSFLELEKEGKVRLPIIPSYASNNAHMFYMLLDDLKQRTEFIDFLKKNDICAPFHYVPLHSSPAGKRFGKVASAMHVTNRVSETLVRLPIFYDLGADAQKKIIDVVLKFWKR